MRYYAAVAVEKYIYPGERKPETIAHMVECNSDARSWGVKHRVSLCGIRPNGGWPVVLEGHSPQYWASTCHECLDKRIDQANEDAQEVSRQVETLEAERERLKGLNQMLWMMRVELAGRYLEIPARTVVAP